MRSKRSGYLFPVLPLQLQRLVIHCFKVAICRTYRSDDVISKNNQSTNVSKLCHFSMNDWLVAFTQHTPNNAFSGISNREWHWLYTLDITTITMFNYFQGYDERFEVFRKLKGKSQTRRRYQLQLKLYSGVIYVKTLM